MSSGKRWTTRIFRHIQTLLPQKEGFFKTSQGLPHPYGATLLADGLNFSLFSQNAQTVDLVLFSPEHPESSLAILPLDPIYNRTGDIWHIMVYEISEDLLYAWRCKGPHSPGYRYQPEALLLDPYAYALSGGFPWGNSTRRLCRVIREDNTKHKFVRARYHRSESILYELHARGFTAHPSSQVASRGTFDGLKEKIPYLAKLGITSVELLPIAEFPENVISFKNPQTGEPLKNLWGYNSLAFFAPKAGFSATGDSRTEFREMVQSFHKANIEVILDVVFNHTAEGDDSGPTLSFRGIDNQVYYLLDKDGRYLNYSGCGNTLKCNHPVVRELILDCLRHWVLSFQVDGFRFDLGSILSRDEEGHLVSNTPLLEQIARDPILSQTKIIMEAWDAGGGYQVGQLIGKGGRFCEWNDRFRDDVRKFWRGDWGMTKALAIRFLGSPDLYPSQENIPHHSINFVTCHDGFTLTDLVSYQQKHNEANGEGNRDGAFENYSSNHGVEGPTEDLLILRHRELKRRALMATLLLSQGIPMLLAGDEFGRTQQGNNNAYCQDNEMSWLNWNLLTLETPFFRWVQSLIAFRKKHPILRRPNFLKQDQGEILWFDAHGKKHSFTEESRTLGILLNGSLQKEYDDDLYLVFHNEPDQVLHPIPPPPRDENDSKRLWLLVADSTRNAPEDFLDSGQEQPLSQL
ncbi:MAG: isoamylase, partial [Planctomycetota bacterium]